MLLPNNLGRINKSGIAKGLNIKIFKIDINV